ncbi:MAG: transposase [Patescibacteria group bacterium]|nr:transposase [Patescibacteria group bacterium]
MDIDYPLGGPTPKWSSDNILRMSRRQNIFANDEFFHVYNRGVDKRIIFTDEHDIQRFFQSMVEFNTIDPIGSIYENSFRQLGGRTPKLTEKLVNIITYCLNPNHFHLILEQLVDGGISEFMKRVGGGFTGYFNNKYERSGALFQGKFKSVHIDSNEYLLHVSAYVNLNDRVHQLGGPTPKLVKSWSSWEEYMDPKIKGICKKEIILGQFEAINEYKKFALSSLKSIQSRKEELKDIRNFLLE